jgi:predicted DNA-binding transcriptional regulator AlpA
MTALIDIDALADAVARRVVDQLKPQTVDAVLLTRAEVAQRLGRSTSTVKRLQMTPGFPKPVRMAGGRPMWRASEIETFLRESEA